LGNEGQNKYQGGVRMKRGFIGFMVALSLVLLLAPCPPQAANPTAAQPQAGGIFKLLVRSRTNVFGYPPRIAGSARDYAPPFFDRLLGTGDDGKYKPMLALSWDTSADGKTITFKLRQGVTFHDGTPFNAQAVKANVDNLIPPKGSIIPGITSVDVVDDTTVKLTLSEYNNLILYHFATNPASYMYSPEAVKKNGADWATTHPVGTGPFMLKDYQPNISLTLVKNPNYWQKGLPYLDGIEMRMVPEAMTQMMTFKAGQAHAIYDANTDAAAQLRDAGYPLQSAGGGLVSMNFDTKNSEIFSKRQVREAIEYAIDKEAICSGPGNGLFPVLYQILDESSPDYNKACPPRKYDPAKAKKLLAEAGYPNGFSFKFFMLDSSWKDGLVAVQSYLGAVSIKMEIIYLNVAAYNLIRTGGQIEKGAAAYAPIPNASNTLYTLDNYWRTNSSTYKYVVKPAGIDKLIDQAKLSRDPAAVTKINQQIIKLIYDDATIIPLWQNPRIAVVDKSVQDTGWFISGAEELSEFGTRTWLKK
jgi:peptide/nickel transport system substrate-binding protein